MSNTDIQALLNGTAAIQTKIEILPQVAGESSIILTESNGVVSWDYEDFRFIKDQGFIGQFIAKQVTGTIKNPSDNFSMTDREFKLQMGIKVGNTLTWYSLGNFLVKKVIDDEVKDTTKFEALDYAKKFNKRYEDTITYPCTMLELVQNICNQCGCELGSTNFKHKDWVIDGNYFQNNESCRDVMKNLGKLAYSWVRVDWDNKVYLDFTKKTTVESYNKITNHEYYSLKTQKEKKIVNRVVIGYSNIDGEQTKVEDTASIKANGLCEITIFDNPLVYNQALREKAIVGASDLLGLEYTPLEMQTVGHPWLKGYELIEATDMEGKVYKTIPFNRTIQYFGHIKSLIKIETETKTNTEYAYESGLKNDFLNAQIQVNKKLGTITSTVDEMNTKVEDITTTTQTSTGGNSLYLKEALESNALEYSIDGKCEQETRSGKNLANIKAGNYSLNGITLTINNGEILLNGTATAATTFTGIGEFLYKTGKTYSGTFIYESGSCTDYGAGLYLSNSSTSNVNIGGGAGFRQNQSRTFNITSKTENIQEYFYIVVNKNTVINNYRIKIQIVEGTTADYNFEQYGASPSPDYPSEIKTIKGIRNLFNKDTVTPNYYFDNSGNLIKFSPYCVTDYIKIEPNKKYTYSGIVNNNSSTKSVYYDKDKNKISMFQQQKGSNTITTPDNAEYVRFTLINDPKQTYDKETFMLEQGSIAHPYIPYGAWAKVKITGKNLFDSSNTADLITGYIGNGIPVTSHSSSKTLFIECKPNTTYTVSRTLIGGRFTICDSEDKPVIGTVTNYLAGGNFVTANYYTITTSSNANYLLVWYSNTGGGTNLPNNNGYTEEELRNSIMIEEGSTATEYEPYKEKELLIDLNIYDEEGNITGHHELCSIGDTKDALDIVNGQVVIDNKIGKVVLNGSESWSLHSSGNFYSTDNILSNTKTPTTINEMPYISSTHFKTDTYKNVWQNITNNAITISNDGNNNPRISFDSCKTVADFKSWLKANPVTVYYELREPEIITLPNTNIPLYEGVNHVTLVEDLETTTSIKYLRKTPISGEYALNQDLNKTNSNLADTNNQLSQTQSDIDNTKTNLNNNYYNKEQVDSINSTTTQNITQIRNTMEQNITSTNASISKIQEEITNGVSKVTTTTGTFDENGLNISKSGQQMSSTLDWDGLEVVRDKRKATETEVLTVRSAGVEAENMTVRNFFIKKPIRIEKCKSVTDSTKVGLGFFWIGE